MAILRRTLAAVVVLVLAASVSAAPASAAPVITITFVRHAESEANASGIIDTTVPGPSLTPKGEQQAKDAAVQLSRDPNDGIYASSMIRTQQTAHPLADELGQQIVVLPGLREIEAGDFEGQSERDASAGYLQPLEQWLQGNRFVRIPGSIDGNEFDARFDDAVDTVYRSGQQRPVAFWHGAGDRGVDDDERRQSPARPRAVAALAEHRLRRCPGQSAGRLDAARLEWNKARLAGPGRDDLRDDLWSIFQCNPTEPREAS